jgi:predicted outer membrane protein
MRKLFPAVLLMLAAGLAVAQEPTPTRESANQATEAKGKKEMTAIVVSADRTVKTITVRSKPGSEPETLPVAEVAAAKLDTVKAGEKVKLVLSMDSVTNKETVTSIETPSPHTAKP